MRSTRRAFRVFGISLVAAFSLQANAQELEQLQREWWQWAMAIPASQNPILDKTGNNCGMGQHGDVWFLAGSTGSTLTRTCSVPTGARLFVPVVNTFCFPDPAFSEAFCVTDTDDFIDSFDSGTLLLEVDGAPVFPVDVRDETDFNIAVGKNGVFGNKPGIYRATIARGHWGLVGPLDAGLHSIHVRASGPLFGLDVTYALNVVEPAN